VPRDAVVDRWNEPDPPDHRQERLYDREGGQECRHEAGFDNAGIVEAQDIPVLVSVG
jgi:hypothetical protein